MDFADQLALRIASGGQAFFVHSKETARCEALIGRAAEKMAKLSKDSNAYEVVTWDCVRGFSIPDGEAFRDIAAAFKNIKEVVAAPAIVVFKNAHFFLTRSPEARQAFKNLCEYGGLNTDDGKHPVVFLSNIYEVHPEIRHDITDLELTLPDADDLSKPVDALIEKIRGNNSNVVALETDPGLKDRIIRSMFGLTTVEAINTLYYAVRATRGFKPETVTLIEDEKAKVLGSDGILTYTSKDRIASRDEIGDYEELLTFIDQRALAYSSEAATIGLDTPRGTVLLGIPGSGKSVAGKAIARILGLPLVNMDVTAVFNSLVGASEGNMRAALAQVRALKGCVLLIDEADKLFQGQGDTSGTSQRIMGSFLTWLTDRPKDDRTFVVATMNHVDGIPDAMLRAGRFDKVFYAGIPDAAGRWEIFKIHCAKRGVDSTRFSPDDQTKFIKATDDFVGAEIEEVVKAARFVAFADRRSGDPTVAEFISEAAKITPVVKMKGNGTLREKPEFAYPVCGKKKSVKAAKPSRAIDLDTLMDT